MDRWFGSMDEKRPVRRITTCKTIGNRSIVAGSRRRGFWTNSPNALLCLT
jgi:hypothetical protein